MSRSSRAWLIFWGVLLVLCIAINVWTVLWCRSLPYGGCIPVHMLLTVPLNAVAALAVLVYALRALR